MALLKVKLNSLHTLLMHNPQGVDPMNKYTVALKKFTGKRVKTEEDHIAISELSWTSAMYYIEGVGPHIPPEMIEACIRDGAKKTKKGKTIQANLRVVEDVIPLEYNGPRELEAMRKSGNFRDFRVGKLKGKTSINITRPRFDRWSIQFTLEYNDQLIDVEELKEIIRVAGQQACIGDYRPRYGKFEPVFL